MSEPSRPLLYSFVSEKPSGLLCYTLAGQDRYSCASYCYASGFRYSGQQTVADGAFQCVCCSEREGIEPPDLLAAVEPADSPNLWQMFLLPERPKKTYEPSESERERESGGSEDESS